MKLSYDIVVIGAGHAGCEAASAAARLGSRTLLITIDMDKIAAMSCNPAVGGVAKGQIVREIDALGGMMGRITDKSAIQFRMLNRSKGAAMWSPRAQCDKAEFSRLWRRTLENTPNLYLWQDSVTGLLIDHSEGRSAVRGVKTRMGVEIACRKLILTAGTFLEGMMHCGEASAEGGRAGDQAAHGITAQLRAEGFEAGRMKTGTPARLDARTINFEALELQEGDEEIVPFSYSTKRPRENTAVCFRLVGDGLNEVFDQGGDLIDLITQVHPDVQGHLIVPGAGGVELLAHITDAMGQDLLHKHVDIFTGHVEFQRAGVQVVQNARETLDELVGIFICNDMLGGQHGGVGHGAGDILPVHPAVKMDRGVEIVRDLLGCAVSPSGP